MNDSNTPASRVRLIPIILLFGLATFFVGMQVGESGRSFNLTDLRVNLPGKEVPNTPPKNVKDATPPKEAKNVSLENFWRVWNLLHAEHINKANLDDQKLVYGAIKGMVEALDDPYTAYLAPEENKQFAESLSGTYEGIGAELGMREDQLIIVAPLDGSPAEKAGIQAQDAILKIDDKDTRGITIPQAVGKIRGKAGEAVSLTLGRAEQDAFTVNIVRDKITIKSVAFDGDKVGSKQKELAEKGIGYLRLSRFGDNTMTDWETSLSQMRQQITPLKAVILDLRNNPGGYLSVSIELAGDFLRRGTPVVSQEMSSGEKTNYSANGKERLANVPIVILVNEGSASASEILTAALKENRTDVQIVGKKTYGKGTVQEKKDLPDGSGIQVTIAKWLTSKGVWVTGQGIPADIEVSISREDIVAGKDPQLTKAIEVAASY